jgi:hypothetical protein
MAVQPIQIALPLLFLIVLHICLPTHKGKIPRRLCMRDTAPKVPFLLQIMFPVVIIDIIRFAQLHAIQAETMEVVGDVAASFFDRCHTEPGPTAHASIFRDLAIKLGESGTGEDLENRLFVVVVKWPNAGLAETHVVCEE